MPAHPTNLINEPIIGCRCRPAGRLRGFPGNNFGLALGRRDVPLCLSAPRFSDMGTGVTLLRPCKRHAPTSTSVQVSDQPKTKFDDMMTSFSIIETSVIMDCTE